MHTVNGGNLGNYIIEYAGLEFSQANNLSFQLPCTSAATDLNFILDGFSFSGFDFFIDAGVYQDVVHVEVTTQ